MNLECVKCSIMKNWLFSRKKGQCFYSFHATDEVYGFEISPLCMSLVREYQCQESCHFVL